MGALAGLWYQCPYKREPGANWPLLLCEDTARLCHLQGRKPTPDVESADTWSWISQPLKLGEIKLSCL